MDERGHIAGYAYGWLGLTYGMFQWWGLAAVYLVFMAIFKMLNRLRRRPGLMNIVLFFYMGSILLEFFGNLGLDSFIEKVFKGFISVIIFVVLIKLIENIAAKQARLIFDCSDRGLHNKTI